MTQPWKAGNRFNCHHGYGIPFVLLLSMTLEIAHQVPSLLASKHLLQVIALHPCTERLIKSLVTLVNHGWTTLTRLWKIISKIEILVKPGLPGFRSTCKPGWNLPWKSGNSGFDWKILSGNGWLVWYYQAFLERLVKSFHHKSLVSLILFSLSAVFHWNPSGSTSLLPGFGLLMSCFKFHCIKFVGFSRSLSVRVSWQGRFCLKSLI